MKALLLSAYDADSHRRWRQGLVAQLEAIDWSVLTLPPRHFRWRIRGSGLSWGFSGRAELRRDYNLLVATSMVDLASLRGFLPHLARLPTLVYFHENQFAYPTSQRQSDSVEPRIVNLYTALCADRLAFNSEFNRRTFLAGAGDLLRRLPDHVPPGLVAQLRDKSVILPVPLEDHCFVTRGAAAPGGRLTLLWNHRWEYDKGPERLLRALQHFVRYRIPFQLHVVGRQFRRVPAEFEQIRALLQAHDALGAWGFQQREADYRQLLASADAVVSTAVHDFQGLAVMEAVAAGCHPLVPQRQAYPEWFGGERCYTSLPDDSEGEAEALALAIRDLALRKQRGDLRPPVDMAPLGWRRWRQRYRQVLQTLAA